MHFKLGRAKILMLLIICGVLTCLGGAREPAFTQTKADHLRANETDFITAEELKAKVNRKEPVTIIDVRGTGGYISSDNKIKGAIHIKLRRLKSRLNLPPLKDVPRDRQIVTYCACPNDESSVRAIEVLRDAGFTRVTVLKGGWEMWLKAGGPVEARPRG